MEGDPQNFRPPVLVGERVAWMGSGSGLPQGATVRWIGRIPEITTGWTVGIELDIAMPVGGIDGTWRKRQLFSCEPKHGLLVPIDKIMKQSSLMRTRHSIGEKFYEEGRKPTRQPNQDLIRKLSLPQSANSKEFLCRVLPAGNKKPQCDPPEVGLSFKAAASQIQKPLLEKQASLDSKTAPLTIANVRTLEKISENAVIPAESRLQTFDELEKFKKHLDELVQFKKNEFGSKRRSKKLGKNPESLYELAKPVDETEKALFLRVVGEKRTEVVEPPKRKQTHKSVPKSPQEVIPEEPKVIPQPVLLREVENFCEPEHSTTDLEIEKFETEVADELVEETFCNEWAASANVEIHETEAESLTQPAPTIRRKRQKEQTTPVPSPRRKSQDARALLEDTSSVLYEPDFLRDFEPDSKDMSDVRGTFRRIDEDELEKRLPPARRLLTSSVSVPVTSRKGLFSFLRWFKKKPKDDLDLDAFNAPSVTSSPLFTRSRLANAESIDTLYSIATVSSFAFVSGAQYQNRISSDKRKKRRAPPPPRDVSLPSTLETRARQQQHRRSVSESYKDRKSGAFAHVNGKRKAPPPPARLYPSLNKVENGSLTNRKKRPAPLPPEPEISPPTSDPQPEVIAQPATEPEPVSEVVCNDTLKLERGVLKPNKIAPLPSTSPTHDVPKIPPTSPVSPRPWYKRKSLEKRKEKPVIDWLPEISAVRTPTDSPLKFNFFSRNEEKKKDEKRKSGISWLANISELDREAAEICRKEQAHQQELLDAGDAKFYETEPEIRKRSSTRELISLFNAIGNVNAITVNPRVIENSQSCRESEQQEPAISACDKPEIKLAAVVETKDLVVEDAGNSKAQALFEQRGRRHHSPSPTVSTIAEISEPPSSVATLNQYSEAVWVCRRCTLENFLWNPQCDVCSSKKPDGKRMNERRKSEMEFEIDWERELEKYFPDKKSPEVSAVSGKLMFSKAGDVVIKTEEKQGDLDELRRKRLAFFMKSLGNDAPTSLRDAAAKKSLDAAEKSKLKGMLKEMKDSLPKYEGVKNNLNAAGSKNETLPDVTGMKIDSEGQKYQDSGNYGAIRRKPAEAFLVTATTVKEDIFVRKKTNGQLKKTRRVGNEPFELMRARDLANIIETKTGNVYPAHVYANYPSPKISDDGASSSSLSDTDPNREVARLATQLTRAAGVAEFKASLDPSDANTLAVNRLLRRLETAIAAGRHDQAATLARELAGLKVNCSVTRQRPSPSPSPTFITLEMYVEDKLTHQGPIPIKVQKTMTLADLKIKVQVDFQIPGHVQRWILGKQLATEEYKTLEEFGVTMDKCPIFLYLVAPEPEPEIIDSAPSETTAIGKENDDGARARTPPQLGKGWYYNYEEDRYSFCNSDSEDDNPKAAAVKVIQRTIEKQKSKSPPDVVDRNDEGLQPPQQAKPFSPKRQRPPLVSSLSEPAQQDTPVQELSQENGQAAAARPRSRSIFDLIKPQANDTLKKDLKVISVNAVKETIEKLTRRGEDLQKNGWKCEACTLVNAANRMVCSVCFAARPTGYMDPVKRPIEEELRRLRRDQALDLFIDESAKPAEDKQHYLQLVNLDGDDVVPNTEPFDCPICVVNYSAGEGVVLKECLHTFCRECLVQTVKTNEEAEVKCPFMDYNYSCECVLQQREIKALVPKDVFEQYLARSVAQAENRMGNAFHCKTPDCKGWCILEDNVNEFPCPVCKHVNCLNCQAIHEGVNCRTYQDRLATNSDGNNETKRTKTMLEEMVQKGDAMACPTCQVVLMKKWGCDWLRCSMCKTEICWVTRGPRWGPAGKGDTSAGCKCGVNGIKCHPKCNYCH